MMCLYRFMSCSHRFLLQKLWSLSSYVISPQLINLDMFISCCSCNLKNYEQFDGGLSQAQLGTHTHINTHVLNYINYLSLFMYYVTSMNYINFSAGHISYNQEHLFEKRKDKTMLV